MSIQKRKLKKLSLKRKSAIPEYIWYISLIIISITLVVTIANIAKKGNKNIEPPSNVNIQFDVQIDPNNVVKIKELNIIGQWDNDKDTKYLYLCCNNICKNLLQIFNSSTPTDLLVRKVSGGIGLKAYGGLILFNPNDNSTDLINSSIFDKTCYQKGAIWRLYYGDPNEGGVMLTQDKVNRKWSLS